MAVEFMDLLGVLAVVAFLAGLGAVSVRAMLLRRQQLAGSSGVTGPLLVALTALYIILVAFDATSVVAVLTNRVDDIPPASTFRTALIAGIMWLLHAVLLRLAYGRAP